MEFRNNRTKISIAAIAVFICTEAFHELGARNTDKCNPFVDFQVCSTTRTMGTAAWRLQGRLEVPVSALPLPS